MQIAIIAGEASGDRVGGQLAREIRRLRPDAHFWGAGGTHLREAGVETLVDASRWGVVGIASGLKILPRVLAARAGLHRELARRKPDLIIPIDAGAFNIGFAGIQGLCPWVRAHLPQTRILYYFPPGSWRRTLKATPLVQLADLVATPFSWSETELTRLGANAVFVGHPLLDLVKPTESAETFAARYGVDRERPLVALLPGSRAGEITHLLPVQLAAASIIHRRVPGTQFLLGLAPTVDRDTVVRFVERERRERAAQTASNGPKTSGERTQSNKGRASIPVPAEGGAPLGDTTRRQSEWIRRAAEMPPPNGDFPLAIVEAATYDTIAAADVALVTSGTATLETAILGKPMVISYKMASINKIEYQLAKARLPAHIGMPNILAGRRIVPEFIQEAATPDALASEVIGLLLEPERMLRMKADLREAVSHLGEEGGAARVARLAVALAEGATPDEARVNLQAHLEQAHLERDDPRNGT